MRSSADFRRATRGVRVGRPTLVVHARRTADDAAAPVGEATGVRVGFVVSRAVGNAVTRNRVKRRLRHLANAQLEHTPPGTDLVVRALPRAATDPVAVPADLVSAWSAAITRASRTGGSR